MLVTYKPGNKHLNADFFSRLKRYPSGPYMVKLIGAGFNDITDHQVFQALVGISSGNHDKPHLDEVHNDPPFNLRSTDEPPSNLDEDPAQNSTMSLTRSTSTGAVRSSSGFISISSIQESRQTMPG